MVKRNNKYKGKHTADNAKRTSNARKGNVHRSANNKKRYIKKKTKKSTAWAMITALSTLIITLSIVIVVMTVTQPKSSDAYMLALPTVEPTTMPVATEPASEQVMDEPLPEKSQAENQLGNNEFEDLPIYHRAETNEKKIAITVDDCFQVNNLKTIVKTAYTNGGKLTLFPIGENISKPGMAEVLKKSVLQLGFEIENHTWSHQRVFRLSEEEMANEIWKQSQAVNQMLGVNYEQHFFRLMGGDGKHDQRTHNYLNQLGFRGIADWSISGSDASLEDIAKSLAPGQIYLFHTTDGDTEKLKKFIPYAVKQGYSLVTLNELLGYEENATSEITQKSKPEPCAYQYDYRDNKKGDYAWSVVQMQNRLSQLGYLKLTAPASGYYGDQTAQAVSAFQSEMGLNPTGIADKETQKKLF